MSNTVDQYADVAKTLASARDAELAELAFSMIELSDPEIGLLAGSKVDRIRAWIGMKFERACRGAGAAGAEALRILNDDRTRGDAALAAILAAALTKALGIYSVPIEEVVALSLLLVRLYQPRTEDAGSDQ